QRAMMTLTHRPGAWKCAAVLMLAAGLAACNTVQVEPAQTPLGLPAGFAAGTLTEGAGGRVLAEHWWRDFGDVQLDHFVETALVRNPSLAQAIARARIAEARTRLQRADLLPQVGLGAGATRQRQTIAGMPGVADAGAVISTGHNAAVEVSWELDL